MTQAYQKKEAVSETVSLAFKRHILEKSAGFASEPMADAFRVSLLAQMLDRYDALRAKGVGEQAAMHRTMYEFDDIAAQMRDMGFEETQAFDEENLSRWPQLSQREAEDYIRARDAYLHKTSLGIMLCSACVTPLMIAAAFSEVWYSDAFAMLGLMGMFAMIGMGVYAMVTAVKPKNEKKIKKGRFSLSRGLRRMLEQMKDAVEAKSRKRKGIGVALIVTSLIPMFAGAAFSEIWYSDAFPMMGLAGMFLMIGAGVYELVMADGEKKTIQQLLDPRE
ncbi:MAG: hypothetical protein E7321_05425 [Clostridiales bacterium]|nr:hypothetical protein [Clostridiales bacterium]